MKKGLSVAISSDKGKVKKQIAALEWQLKQPGEDQESRAIHEETLRKLREHIAQM